MNANEDGISVTFAKAEENNVIPIDKKKLDKQKNQRKSKVISRNPKK